jgi:hypothetical protein
LAANEIKTAGETELVSGTCGYQNISYLPHDFPRRLGSGICFVYIRCVIKSSLFSKVVARLKRRHLRMPEEAPIGDGQA